MSDSTGRAITSILNYAILLVVVALLVAGLFLGVSDLTTGQQERAVGSQFVTVGERLAADVGTADRLVRTANTSTSTQVRLESDLPGTVGASQYHVNITSLGGDRYELTLWSTEPEVRRSVVVRSTVGLREDTVPGGPLVIEYNASESRLVIRRA